MIDYWHIFIYAPWTVRRVRPCVRRFHLSNTVSKCFNLITGHPVAGQSLWSLLNKKGERSVTNFCDMQTTQPATLRRCLLAEFMMPKRMWELKGGIFKRKLLSLRLMWWWKLRREVLSKRSKDSKKGMCNVFCQRWIIEFLVCRNQMTMPPPSSPENKFLFQCLCDVGCEIMIVKVVWSCLVNSLYSQYNLSRRESLPQVNSPVASSSSATVVACKLLCKQVFSLRLHLAERFSLQIQERVTLLSDSTTTLRLPVSRQVFSTKNLVCVCLVYFLARWWLYLIKTSSYDNQATMTA